MGNCLTLIITCNISNMRDSVSSVYPNTEKSVENATRSISMNNFRQEKFIILLIPGLAFTGSEYQYLGSGQLEPLTWLFDTGQWVPV